MPLNQIKEPLSHLAAKELLTHKFGGQRWSANVTHPSGHHSYHRGLDVVFNNM